MSYRKRLLITTAALALAPFAAQAATTAWTGGTSTAWATGSNWSGGVPTKANSPVTISKGPLAPANNPLITTNIDLSGAGSSLTVNSLGLLTIGNGASGTLNMGANTITVTSGTIKGPGTLTTTGTDSLTGTLSGLILGGSGGVWNLTGDSTLTGAINFATGSSQTFNTGAHALNLDTATLTATGTGQASFNVASGGTLNNTNKASSITTVGPISLSGGSITNTSGTGGTTAGLFTIANPISGNGTISGNVALTGTGLTASGGTLTVDGGAGAGIVLGTGLAASAAGNTLDLKGNIGVTSSMTMNPGASGLIKLDGANFSKTGGAAGTINTAATVTAGTFDVVAATTFSNVQFSAGTAAGLSIDAPLTLVDAASSVSAKNVSLNGQTVTGLGSLNATSAITTTGASTLAAPFTGGLKVSSGTLDVKSAGTSSAASTITTTLNIDSGGSWTSGNVTNNGIINLNAGGKWTLPNSLTALTNAGTVDLNGGTLQGPTGGSSNNAGMFGAGKFDVTANSTLAGNLGWNSLGNTFNIGGALGAFTLSLDTSNLATVSGSTPFVIGTGGTLNNANGASSMGGGGTVTLNGGTLSSTAGLFKIGDAISGYGLVSGNVDIASTITAAGAGKTLTVDGGSGSGLQLGNSAGSGAAMSTSGGATLDLKGNLSLIEPATANPGTGTIQFDGANFTNAFSSSPVSINSSGLTTSGTFDVVGPNTSTLNNVAFSTGNGANLKVDAPLTVIGGGSVNATNVTVSGTGALNLQNTTGTTTLTTNNLTMANGSTLKVGATHNAISLTGNFSFQQTDTFNGWTHGTTTGLGPDLIMTGGTKASPVTLEAGGVNKGNVAAGYINNFALDSLTLGTGAYAELVDQFANATSSGWVSGVEALYLDGLFGVNPIGNVIPTLNLDGLFAYDLTCPTGEAECSTFLMNGLYTDASGGEINIIGAPVPTPEPATLALFGTGLAGLGLLRRRRR